MPRRTHRLETLRKVRAAARDDRRLRLAEAQHAESILEERRANFDQQEKELRDAKRLAAHPMTFDINQLVSSQRYQMTLDAERTMLDDQWTTLSGEVERRRASLVLADQGVRSVERLAKKMDQMDRTEEVSRDNRELDEAALQTHLRHITRASHKEG